VPTGGVNPLRPAGQPDAVSDLKQENSMNFVSEGGFGRSGAADIASIPTEAAVDHLVAVKDRAVGEKATMWELKDPGDYAASPDLAWARLPFLFFGKEYAAQGFNAPDDIIFTVISNDPYQLWSALNNQHDVSPLDLIFTRIL
jgi:hypothetical protein